MPFPDSIFISADYVLYVGTAGGIDVLTRVTASRTDGSRLNIVHPATFEQTIRANAQAAEPQVSLSLTFLEVTLQVMNLANGNPLTETLVDAPPAMINYAICLLHPNEDGLLNFYIPEITVTPNKNLNLEQLNPTKEPLLFSIQGPRNRFNQPYFQGSSTYIATAMGGRSPF
jgi:hypothetical protein